MSMINSANKIKSKKALDFISIFSLPILSTFSFSNLNNKDNKH